MKSVLLLLLICSVTFAQAWGRYIPEKKSGFEGYITNATRAGNPKAHYNATSISATWQTDLVVREYVSRKIDDERLSNQDADIRYKQFRTKGEYYFVLSVSSTRSYAKDRIKAREVFLQSAADNKRFVKGVVSEGNEDYSAGSFLYVTIVVFPTHTDSGEALIKSIDEEMELSVGTFEGPVVLKYKIKDLVTRLEDL